MAAAPEGGYYSLDEIEAAARSAGELLRPPLVYMYRKSAGYFSAVGARGRGGIRV